MKMFLGRCLESSLIEIIFFDKTSYCLLGIFIVIPMSQFYEYA